LCKKEEKEERERDMGRIVKENLNINNNLVPGRLGGLLLLFILDWSSVRAWKREEELYELVERPYF
jgi:hypothetical protein